MVVALGASRAGVPALVAFLGLGMLLGSDGPGRDRVRRRRARAEGRRRRARRDPVRGRARDLVAAAPRGRRARGAAATVGVVVTALLTGLAAHALFDLTWLESVLLGAVVSSTDAAAVFATLRFTHIRRRLARTLEAETGGNDPMAIALTIGLIDWIQKPSYGFGDLVLLVLRQLGHRARDRRRARRRGDVGVRAAAALDRRVRAGRVGRRGGALVRDRRRRRRQRLPRRLPGRPRGRQHAVALPAPARLLPRGARLPGAGGDVRRARPARLPQPTSVRSRSPGSRSRRCSCS